MNTMKLTRNNQRGYTLAEILVAVAIFAVIILGALLLYDRSNQVFKQSVEASDMQQSTRVAFDKLTADLRMAGFDYDRDGTPFGALASTWTKATTYTSGMLVQPTNPNGHTYVCVNGGTSGATEPVWPTDEKEQVSDGATLKWEEAGQLQYQQPDEQIEYAGRSAVVIRGNFNYGTATGPCDSTAPCEGGREPKLQSAEFPVVTTANNEIIAYALKPVKWASGESADTLTFYADVAIPRKANPSTDAKESEIKITGVDLCDNGCKSPPYTLYRFTIQDNGQPDAGTPVAENIREMRFQYYSTTTANAADLISTLPNGAGQYDGSKPDAIVAERDTRASIRSVELSLTGMNPQPDFQYTDAGDSVAPNYRKLELKSLITPRNVGRRGMKEYSVDPPEPPTLKSICTGACNAVFLTWTAPKTGGEVESYSVLYDTDKCLGDEMPTGGYQYSEEVGLNLSGSVGRFITPGKGYSFAIQAVSKWGAAHSKCMWVDNVLNKTKPAPLTEFHATHPSGKFPVEKNRIDLYLPPGALNVSGQDALACEGGGNLTQAEMPPAEKRYYEVWRSTDIDFEPEDPGSVRILDAGTIPQPMAAGDYVKWSDLTAANCKDYYYRVRIVDYCAYTDDWNDGGDQTLGQGDWYPALGEKAIAGRSENYVKPQKPSAPILSKEDCTGANCKLTLGWAAVNKNVDDETIYIDEYILKAYQAALDGTFPSSPSDIRTITGGALMTDYDVKLTDTWKFTITAKECLESEESEGFIYPCIFLGGTLTAAVTSGSYGGSGTIAAPYIVEDAVVTAATTSTVSEFRMSVIDTTTGAEYVSDKKVGSATGASFGLPTTLPDGKLMRVLITAVDSKGCTKVTELYVRDEAAPSCALTDLGTDSSILVKNKDNVIYTLKNNSTDKLVIQRIVVDFDAGIGKQLSQVVFNGSIVNTGCTQDTVVVAPAATSEIPASSSTYKLQLNFTDNNLQGANPVKTLCIIYRTPTGDVLGCQIHPNAATCTVPASTCN